MSFFPSPVLVRLQELKLWQGNYDSLLQNKSKDGTNPSDFETIEGLSALDSTNSSPLSSPKRDKAVDWDKKAISPSKPFEELLEEKLALDTPVQIQAKPKRPFLRKGSGLARYKLSQRPSSTNIRTRGKSPVQTTRKNELATNKKCTSASNPSRSSLKSARSVKEKKEETKINLTPLKMPDLAIKPQATWHKVLEVSHSQETDSDDQGSNLDNGFKLYKNRFNSHIIDKINDFNLRRLLPLSPRKTILNKNFDSISTIPEAEVEVSSIEDDSLSCDKNTDHELRIFEALEERAEHSSFSSTNSSIIRLLSSTPHKLKNKLSTNCPILEEPKDFDHNDMSSEIPAGYHVHGHQNTLLQKKLQEVNKRTDVLHNFLRNLRKMGHKSKESSMSSTESVQEKSPDTSFSDEDKWSSNTDIDRSQSLSTSFTDNDTTCKGSTVTKVDVGVNTSIEEKDKTEQTKKCKNCEDLQAKLDNVNKQLPNIQAEKARVCDFAKELEAKRDQLYKEMDKMKQKHEQAVLELKEQIENEKKKFVREKTVFDMYLKDAQNRPTRKEREEVSDLKRELIDVKELLKLKETKNGATQARLRNQIKLLERENSDLKLDIEKLQKENAKLNAAQVMRRPSEVKMLHEINKNLTKLTEETMKKQQNKADTCSNTDSSPDSKKKPPKKSKDENKDRELPRGKKKSPCLKHVTESGSKNNNSDNSKLELTAFADINLEKQYENMFGQFSCPGTINSSLNDSKRERNETVFEDGSREIKYGNGNTKTISPDGNLVRVKYYNGDIKETNLSENTLKYYYAENAIWHSQFGDGTEVLEYPNGQKEKTFPDGRKEVTCSDGSFLFKNPDGTEEIDYPDGSKIIKKLDGEKILLLPNGQKEIHTKEHKRREYPDGTIKILYPDGTQETRYASGRIRIKDMNGALIMDSQTPIL